MSARQMGWTHAVMNWTIPASLVACGALLGLAAERFVVPRLEAAAARRWGGGGLLITSLRGVTLGWFLVAGISLALLAVPLHPSALTLAHKVLLVVFIALVTVALARLMGELVSTYSVGLTRRRGATALPSPSILSNLTKLMIFALGGLVALQSLGIAISPLLTALGVGGLAVALALQETLSNLFSGIYIIVSRQIKPGEYIKLHTGEEGYIVDINWRSTKIREAPNNMIIIPNAKLAAANVTNYYQPDTEVAVIVPVSAGYENDLDRVEQVALEVARDVIRQTPGGIPEFEPVLFYHAFGGDSVNFNVILRVREIGSQARVKHEFVKRLHERFRREGIAFRSRAEVYLRDGSQPLDPLQRAWRR